LQENAEKGKAIIHKFKAAMNVSQHADKFLYAALFEGIFSLLAKITSVGRDGKFSLGKFHFANFIISHTQIEKILFCF
jgi:hypothetical protein